MSDVIKWISGVILGLFAVLVMAATWVWVIIRVYIFRRSNEF